MEKIIRGIAAAALTAMGVYFKAFIVPAVVLAAVMLIDYLTGLAAAWIRHEVSSRAGIIGFLKKIGYIAVVAVGIVVDYVIKYAAVEAGAEIQTFHCFGLLVMFWFIINEIISILENSVKMGVPVPGFLEKIVKRLKTEAEKKGDQLVEEDSHAEN